MTSSLHRAAIMGGLSAAVLAAPAFAHPGGDHSHAGFVEGFAHLFTGLDHLIAMIAVGLVAMRRGGAGAWALPLAVLAATAGGFLLAYQGVTVPFAEYGVLASVGAFVLALGLAKRAPTALLAVIVAAFAVCHGWIHAVELPAGAYVSAYAGGLMSATAALMGVGAAMWVAVQSASRLFVRG